MRARAGAARVLALLALLLPTGCGGRSADVREALATGEPIVLAPDGDLTTAAGARCEAAILALDSSARADVAGAAADAVTIDYPLEGSVFPPGFVPPEFLWHDDSPLADAWLVRVDFAAGAPVFAVVDGPPPEQGWIDRRAISDTNEIYRPTEYQAGAHAWTPPIDLWAAIQRRSHEAPATVVVLGFETAAPERVLSRGRVQITTSRDEVGAPIFYRDVPLMPSVSGETGEIKPLAENAMPLIEWRLRDVRRPEAKLVLTGMPKCANCHSFSLDGKSMGMDVDGPHGDKGAYAMVPVARRTEIDDAHVITWNSFEGRAPEQKTIGFLSRISPDGRYAVTTLNEAIYAASFANHAFLQVFFPTRGILGWTSGETGEVRALPGADDPRYVHVNPVWLPDGETIVFARAEAFDPPMNRADMARYPNDPREPQIRYDLYRMSFDEGRGGTPEPIEGASLNGMSNTFPKVSPDGKWLVYTQCRNGLLMRPDGRLRIVPVGGGESREMRCNTPLMNSWHSFSPNSRWMVFSSKRNTPYTQMFLTHIDENGDDTPAILIPGSTAANRAVNLPEFVNAPADAFDEISVSAVGHDPVAAFNSSAMAFMKADQFDRAARRLREALRRQSDFVAGRVNLAYCLQRTGDFAGAAEELRHAVDVQPAQAFANGRLESMLAGGAPAPPPDVARLRAALAADGSPPAAARALALALARSDDTAEGVAMLSRLLRVEPRDAEARRALGHAFLKLDDVPAAVAQLEAAVALAGDARTLTLLAWLQAAGDVRVRDPRRAVENAKRACGLTAFGDPRALDSLAGALAAAGRYGEAVDAATRALTLARRDTPSLAVWIERRRTLYRAGHHLGEAP